MSGNTFGTLFKVTTFGESHGPAIGAVVDGMPAGVEIDPGFIQSELDRRRPGNKAAGSTLRKESDTVEILSGVFEGKSTGTSIGMLIRNSDQHSKDYSELRNLFRPGHADWGFHAKYGFRDYRGGGRSSGRETASRVAAGAVAKLLLKHYGIEVRACAASIGNVSGDIHKIDWSTVEQNPVRCGDPSAADAMGAAIESTAKDLDSIGGTVYAEITGLPAGLGEPVFDKFDALLAHAMFSIGGVKGLEIGSGFSAAEKRGSENNDPITPEGFATNNAGGILGGISNGDKVTFRVAVKPTPSIYKEQQTIEKETGNATSLVIKGRHDPCLVPRIVPVVEAMAAIVAADLLLRAKTSKLD